MLKFKSDFGSFINVKMPKPSTGILINYIYNDNNNNSSTY